ncbi:E3 ubiquitin-protein ligase UHRF1-like [Gigantopelta aegis]|uniref:E3 ubiquitin-protein ligase UHRF1-like n=1 Tax=Gigantopelta aegis TaxID=1735272 RepID=UPI001B8881BB|nr:E3 ubiquitin-protein ligase UHRF1-like [Gigantopelta aegis]
MSSEYEKLRLQNLADNRRILAEIGLINPFKPLGRVIKKGIKRKSCFDVSKNSRPKKRLAVEVDLENSGSIRGSRRRSARISGKPVGTAELQDDSDDDNDKPKVVKEKRPHTYGPIPGVEVGTVWQMRVECSSAGIHRPTVAGIHGGPEGAYSIALSGGYADNIDLGECFTYTGEGGRDLKGTRQNPKNLRTAPQSKDQTLSRGNLALKTSVDTGRPVRVIRGYKLDSPFAPEEGYRYDGIYTVEKAWYTTGLSGFGVWKFALRRCSDQPSPPWELVQSNKTVKDDLPDSQDSGVGSDTGNSEKLSDQSDSEQSGSPRQSDDEESNVGSQPTDQSEDRLHSDNQLDLKNSNCADQESSSQAHLNDAKSDSADQSDDQNNSSELIK